MIKRLSFLVLLVFLVSPRCVGAAEPGPRPNVILMVADDLATEDLSCYGGTRINTPQIDKLASQGLKLTNYYSGNPVCSPSRMALLAGSYPARLGWRWGVIGHGFKPRTGMSRSVYTIAECFRDAGYRTAITGKWHLGDENMSPEHQGFASSYSLHRSNNQKRDMVRDGQLVQKDWDNRRLTETFAEECIRVINEKSDKPFFLYVPWTAPHFPAEAHPDWIEKHEDEYVGVVEELDFRVGQVLEALEKAGKADHTIVIFTSDNGRQVGQEGQDDQPPYRGKKWQSLEGGTRVPCIVRWPKKNDVNGSNDALMAAIDWYLTLAAMCGVPVNLPEGAQKLDGMDCKAMLMGPKSSTSRNELLFWHGKGQATAIRVGDWKLYFNSGENDPDTSAGPVLYNLQADVKEMTNVANENPDKVTAMLASAKAMLEDIYTNQVPIGTIDGIEAPDAPLEAEDVWGPWLK